MEILESIKDSSAISIYTIGDKWWDLCAGPHVDHTGMLQSDAIELTTISGAYWRGDESKPMLQVRKFNYYLCFKFVFISRTYRTCSDCMRQLGNQKIN